MWGMNIFLKNIHEVNKPKQINKAKSYIPQRLSNLSKFLLPFDYYKKY